SQVLLGDVREKELDSVVVGGGGAVLGAAFFRFLPVRVRLDLAGWAAEGFFALSQPSPPGESYELSNLSALSASIDPVFRPGPPLWSCAAVPRPGHIWERPWGAKRG